MKFICSALLALVPLSNYAHQAFDEHTLVIAEQVQSPFTVTIDPKQPIQPSPAFDASGYLRTIPGFTVARKGGSGGDISLRGQSGSRIHVLSDGQQMSGTCGGRMDPPTNYIAPQNYDEIIVIKGPQTVRHGSVGSAGTVIFDNKRQPLHALTSRGRLSTTVGSFGRLDTAIDTFIGNPKGYWQLATTSSKSDDYTDGNGRQMQSAYSRFNGQTALGWVLGDGHLLEARLGTSTGHADYADRGNKARKIAQDNGAIYYHHLAEGSFYTQLEGQIYTNKNRHIMDSFDTSLSATGVAPERSNQGGHFWLDIPMSQHWQLLLGMDALVSTQKTRMAKSLAALIAKPAIKVYEQSNLGSFLETTYQQDDVSWITGLRWDKADTSLHGSWKNTQDDKIDNLLSGFTRIEFNHGAHEVAVGIGHAERAPDYWEILKTGKQLTLTPEKTTQLDVGWLYRGDIDLSVSLFYGHIHDYILINKNAKPMASNIDAEVLGGEVSLSKELGHHWLLQSSLAYTRGNNTTENRPLAQVSPIEARLACDYHQEAWQLGGYLRGVGAQNRVAIGQGNIVSQDIAPSHSFAVLSINGRYHIGKHLSCSLGIDNLFNKAYAEHISKAGSGNALLPTDERTLQVNEPGRTFWLIGEARF